MEWTHRCTSGAQDHSPRLFYIVFDDSKFLKSAKSSCLYLGFIGFFPLLINRMAATAFHQAAGTIQAHGYCNDSRSQNEYGMFSARVISKGVTRIETGSLKRRDYSSSGLKLGVIRASTSNTSVVDPVSLPSNNKASDSRKKSNETALILIRHGESLWNAKNLFTGCVDVPLTKKGVEEAIEAGKRISNIPVDMIYTSALIRAQMTAMLAMTQHRRKKVPIIMHNESEQAKAWSQVFSEETKKQSIPVIAAWQLNERMYGELQGLNKQETADRFGKEQVHEWRRSYDIPPPNGESLEMCAERAVAYFKEHIEPQLLSGKHVMIAAHGNSLRSIIMYLDKLTSQEVISLELSTGIPMLYIFKEGKFIRRGSPVAPSEAGVYAYTRSLALYRQKLDEMLH
ncbi:2,3-bisphosphoglycerate-dependent phosphoglycerate mutase [Cinnamomum micranthum f. kanehirae]|uniref:phosphoglycerate mutase (2,3-diphosphoglycerate-dependent) n=1 Tax=Cinnamomum micranthum f. kanehirae TaxID=337451 RepID=A0A443PQI0_9MAGN|nr:2,3-bisphosphoglycerate-dependent phosphoglycerate mutase [Cinnamomum micranthum f. kanehirae]